MKKPNAASKTEPSRVCLNIQQNIRDDSGSRNRVLQQVNDVEREQRRLGNEISRLQAERRRLGIPAPSGIPRPGGGPRKPLLIDAVVTVSEAALNAQRLYDLDQRLAQTERARDKVRDEVGRRRQALAVLDDRLQNHYRQFRANGCEGSPMSWRQF